MTARIESENRQIYAAYKKSFKSRLGKVEKRVQRLGIIAEAPLPPPVQLTDKEVNEIERVLKIQIKTSKDPQQGFDIPISTGKGIAYIASRDGTFKASASSIQSNTKRLRRSLYTKKDEILTESRRHQELYAQQRQKTAMQAAKLHQAMEKATRPHLRFDSSHSFTKLHEQFGADLIKN